MATLTPAAAPTVPGLRLRPLGMGDVIDETIRLYRRNLWLLVGIGAVAQIPPFVLSLVASLFFNPMSFSEVDGDFGVVGIALSFVAGLSAIPAFWVSMGALTCASADLCSGRQPTIKSAYAALWRRALPYLGYTLLVWLILIALSVTVLGIPVAIYFAIAWSLGHVLILVERRGVLESLKRSRYLVRGNWWRVLGIVFVLSLLYNILSSFFAVPGSILSMFAMLAELPGIVFALAQGIATLFTMFGQVAIQPVMFGGVVMLYYDLRVRREGLDLERQAAELGLLPAMD